MSPIKAFATLAGKMGEDNIVQSSGPTVMTPKQIDKEIASLQAPYTPSSTAPHFSITDAQCRQSDLQASP